MNGAHREGEAYELCSQVVGYLRSDGDAPAGRRADRRWSEKGEIPVHLYVSCELPVGEDCQMTTGGQDARRRWRMLISAVKLDVKFPKFRTAHLVTCWPIEYVYSAYGSIASVKGYVQWVRE